jgi:Outer membrane protein beta-barrel domain
MKKLTDQELDSVFKNAVEGYEPAFDAAAWDTMNAKLDQPRPTLWKRWMSYTLVGLIIFSTGVWVGTYLNKSSSGAQIQSGDKALSQEERTTIDKDHDQTRFTDQLEGKDENNVKVEKDADRKKLLWTVTEDNGIENTNWIGVTDNSSTMDEATFILNGVNSSLESGTIVTSNTADSVLQEVKEDTIQTVTEDSKKDKQPINSHPVFLRILASPDFSSINYSSATSTGSNYALLVEYQLSNRWSISTGGIWSMKKYATDEEFTYGKYTADQMTGECRILDIPLNIYYRFRPEAKFSFSAGVGFSSYIMQEEEYTYTFDFPSGSRVFSDYIEGENSEWFKVLNLSLGMQYQIAPRIHLQAEPFLKAPLSGVGEWDVLLSSMGIFLGLKYKIN